MELVIDYLESSKDILQLGAQPRVVGDSQSSPYPLKKEPITLCLCSNIKFLILYLFYSDFATDQW